MVVRDLPGYAFTPVGSLPGGGPIVAAGSEVGHVQCRFGQPVRRIAIQVNG